MSFKEFDQTDINEAKDEYAKEVKERWGNTDAYKEYQEKTANHDKNAWDKMSEEGKVIFKEFADCRMKSPESEEAMKLVLKWQQFITKNYYKCTKEILSCLGMMYVSDERFRNNLNQYGDGTAEFMSKAIENYCKQ